MIQLFTIFLFLFSSTTFGRTADELLKSGIKKHNSKDFAGAISDYTWAIKSDKNLRDAYFNRGICEFALQDLKSAKKDFDKTIELDPEFVKAYYSRGYSISKSTKIYGSFS